LGNLEPKTKLKATTLAAKIKSFTRCSQDRARG